MQLSWLQKRCPVQNMLAWAIPRQVPCKTLVKGQMKDFTPILPQPHLFLDILNYQQAVMKILAILLEKEFLLVHCSSDVGEKNKTKPNQN